MNRYRTATKARPPGIASELMCTYNEGLDLFLTLKQDIARIKSLRPSQLPFCPISFFVRHATHGALRSMDMSGDFYTGIGTAVHTTAQTYLSQSGKFLASWECKQCGKRYKVSMQHECCDFPMKYHEIEIDHKGIVGHIDAVFRDSLGNYWILDFKTTSIKSSTKKLKQPGASYVEQVEAYALMLWLQYGIRVKGVILMFIKRDNPRDPVVWHKELSGSDFQQIKTRMIEYKRRHREVLAITAKADAIALARYGRCANPWCSTCKSAVPLKKQLSVAYTRGSASARLPLKHLS